MNFGFRRTDDGIATDKEVLKAVAPLDSLVAQGNLIIEAKWLGDHKAFCKIDGPRYNVVAEDKKMGVAVRKAVNEMIDKMRAHDKKISTKRAHARNKATKAEVASKIAEEESVSV